MADPQTINTLLNVPLRGSNPGTWDLPVNFDFTAIDGLFGGVGSIGVSNANISLTAPAGAAVPGPGPYQSQNRVLRFSGLLTAHVTVTLPLAAEYVCENFTTGNFNLILRAIGSGEVVAIPPGLRTHVYCDGTNVRFVYGIADRPGTFSFEAGATGLEPWMLACTMRPYLLCDGTVYNVSDFPYVGNKLLGKFGGNGVTTFATPDLGGRVPLNYDFSGTRITAAGCGLNGQTIGAALDAQIITLTSGQIPAHTHPNTLNDPGHVHTFGVAGTLAGSAGGIQVLGSIPESGHVLTGFTDITITNAANTGGGGAHGNVQPSLVSGVWLIKT